MRARWSIAFIIVSLLSASTASAQAISTGFANVHNTCQGFNRGGPFPNPGDSVFIMVVTRIDTLSPAGVAGVRTGDQIVAINGVRNVNPPDRRMRVRLVPGDSNVVTVVRQGIERDVRFIIGEWMSLPADSVVISLEGTPTNRVCRTKGSGRG